MELPKVASNRIEQILLAIAKGDNSILPTPRSDIEQILVYIALNGGFGGSGGSATSINWNNITNKPEILENIEVMSSQEVKDFLATLD